jgi:ferredoxin-NADP reductase
MLSFIDNILNRITMYRLVLYYLIFLALAALGLSYFNLISFAPADILISSAIILLISWAANSVFARVFRVPSNSESFLITALILILIISPQKYTAGSGYFLFLGWASVLAQASKYILAIRRRHIFNPAAFSVAVASFAINHSASWWVGTLYMLPFVFLGGVLVVRKIRRADMVWAFLGAALATIIFTSVTGGNFWFIVYRTLAFSSLFFFAFIMLTEPLTTPPKKTGRILYGLLTGFLFAPSIHFGSFYSTPELALLVGNIFSYVISPKTKYLLTLKSKIKTGTDTADFVFEPDRRAKFEAGQYLEWTLSLKKTDSRGNRRYFTIASSPTEPEVRIGVKFYPNSSLFKTKLISLKPGDQLLAGQLAGDFILPRNKNQKLAFIAGGIGVTPFRSMVKYLLDKNEQRDVVLFYSNKTIDEINYSDVFTEAGEKIGMKAIYTLTDENRLPDTWQGAVGKISPQMIAQQAPDYLQRTFYISGPNAMVTAFEQILKSMGVHKNKIKTDFFPGFA